MQILLDNDEFTFRYWDWTILENRKALFVFNKLGVSATDGVPATDGRVTGNLMNNWYIVCALTNGESNTNGVCDPTITPGNRNVFRCGKVHGNCGHPGWPDEANVRRGLNDFANYRTNTNPEIANKYNTKSFSNYMEGFAVDDNSECGMFDEDKNLLCGKEPFIRRRLHNLVRKCS